MKKILIIIGIAIFLSAMGIWWSQSFQSQKIEKAAASGELISQTGIHRHPELSITINGVKQPVPANIGIGMQYSSYPHYDSMMMMTDMHTHDDSGIMHWEVMQGPVMKDDVRLRNFFGAWVKTFNKDCIFEYCNGSNGTVKMLVNGKENTEFENYAVQDKDKIEIVFSDVKNSASAPPKSPGYFKNILNMPVLMDNKPYFLYVGTKFCPFCAAERWSLVKALSRFGTWSGLRSDTSADEEASFSRLPTYDFVGAKYESKYVAFVHKELADRNGFPISGQELTDFEEKWFNLYNPRGSVPFLFLGGQYVQVAAGYSPDLLGGKTFLEVKQDLGNNADTQLVVAINKEADIIIAYLCKSTDNQPTDVCAKPDIAMLINQIQ